MNKKLNEQDKLQPVAQEEKAHVHGPHCNHGKVGHAPMVRQTPKVGRNDECTCGSQKKFKKCCGK